MANTTTGLRLKADTKLRLENLGKLKDRSTSYLMNEAIELYLEREEALENEKRIVNARWNKFELTGEAIDHDRIKSWSKELQSSIVSDSKK